VAPLEDASHPLAHLRARRQEKEDKMSTFSRTAVFVAGAMLLSMSWPDEAQAQARRKKVLTADLVGFEEPPSVSSTGSGTFRAKISRDELSFEYELEFQDLEGEVTQAHIHFGQKGVNGGISIWLCGTAANPGPAGTPDCGGPSGGSVTRTVDADDVVGPNAQGIAPSEFAEVLRAMREGVAYANVHSTRNTGGEIRGQIK
jgi:hypothetical protein